jgi:hypothetical protein
MYSTELVCFIVTILIILITPYLPTTVLLYLDHMISRVAIVILLLYLISMGPTEGIFGFIVVGVLYLERNRRKVSSALIKLDEMDAEKKRHATVEEAGRAQTTVPVASFDEPYTREMEYVPSGILTGTSDNFEPVAPSINEKAVLSSIYPLPQSASASSISSDLFEKMGVGHLAI